VTIFQYVQGEMYKALLYLISYNIGMISPLLVLSLLIYKGKDILDVSEKIVDYTSYIKVLNIILLVLVFVLMFILM